jgi:hypothetical protein
MMLVGMLLSYCVGGMVSLSLMVVVVVAVGVVLVWVKDKDKNGVVGFYVLCKTANEKFL